MTCVTFGAEMIARLGDVEGLVEVRDDAGRTIGYFRAVDSAGTKRTPFSREEIERRRQQRTGRPLGDVLKGLRQP